LRSKPTYTTSTHRTPRYESSSRSTGLPSMDVTQVATQRNSRASPERERPHAEPGTTVARGDLAQSASVSVAGQEGQATELAALPQLAGDRSAGGGRHLPWAPWLGDGHPRQRCDWPRREDLA